MKNVENSKLLSTLRTKKYLPLEAIIAMKATQTKTRNRAIFPKLIWVLKKIKEDKNTFVETRLRSLSVLSTGQLWTCRPHQQSLSPPRPDPSRPQTQRPHPNTLSPRKSSPSRPQVSMPTIRNKQATPIYRISTSLPHAGHAHTVCTCADQLQAGQTHGIMPTLRSHPYQERLKD